MARRPRRGPASSCAVARARPSLGQLHEAPRRDERPAGFQQEESVLAPLSGQDGEDRRTREVQEQVAARLRRERAALRAHEGDENQQRSEDLDELVHDDPPHAPSSDRVRRELSSGRPPSTATSLSIEERRWENAGPLRCVRDQRGRYMTSRPTSPCSGWRKAPGTRPTVTNPTCS